MAGFHRPFSASSGRSMNSISTIALMDILSIYERKLPIIGRFAKGRHTILLKSTWMQEVARLQGKLSGVYPKTAIFRTGNLPGSIR